MVISSWLIFSSFILLLDEQQNTKKNANQGYPSELFKTLVLGKVSKNKIRTDGCHCSFPQRAQRPNSSSRKIAKYTKFSASVVPTPDFPQNFQFGEFLASSHIGYLCSSLEGSRLTQQRRQTAFKQFSSSSSECLIFEKFEN